MGIEWHLACTTCREHAWLGSMKPWKWHGFQAGDRFVAALFAVHRAPDCRLRVAHDAGPTPAWEQDDATLDGWNEDLRSRTWWSATLDGEGDAVRMHCGTCSRRLDAPGDEPLVIGRYLWFCGAPCRDAFALVPGRTWRPLPDRAPDARLTVACLCCRTETTLDLEPESAEAFAVWLCDHLYDPSAGEGGCALVVRTA